MRGNAVSKDDDGKPIERKDTAMNKKHNVLSGITLGIGLALALAFACGCKTDTGTSGQMPPMKGGEHLLMPK